MKYLLIFTALIFSGCCSCSETSIDTVLTDSVKVNYSLVSVPIPATNQTLDLFPLIGPVYQPDSVFTFTSEDSTISGEVDLPKKKVNVKTKPKPVSVPVPEIHHETSKTETKTIKESVSFWQMLQYASVGAVAMLILFIAFLIFFKR